MIPCFMPRNDCPIFKAQDGYIQGWGGGSLWGFWLAILRTHCPGVPWLCQVWFCLARLILLAQAKSFSLP